MSARFFIVVIAFIQFLYYVFESMIIEKQRKKPLPEEVSDIYEEDRYKTYLKYAKDNRILSIVIKVLSFVILVVLTYSHVYEKIENLASGNVVGIYFLTYALYFGVETVESYILSYYDTFYIEEKYGLNKKDKKEFHREFILNLFSEIVMMSLLSFLILFIGEHLPIWTNHFTLSFMQVFMICLLLVGVLGLFVVLASFFSIWMMKKQYTFTPLEGELKEKIMALQNGVKKKVDKIYIYDESKKSTTKNAFLLRFLWIKEFGIADNFIKENAEEELLAVLSHEIGHLKHKKDFLDYMGYLLYVLFFLILVGLLSNISIFEQFLSWICTSFELEHNNYYINIQVIMSVITPIMYLFGIYRNYNIRRQEYEADEEAVKNGYGEVLISTFKKLSSDQLINVYPSPIIEFLEYDHPGMYQRIKAMRKSNK